MQAIKVSKLIPHPQNNEFFDDMGGGKWKEFLESVKTSGVIEPIVVTENLVIVSGHQRVRACKELGIEEILCEVRAYEGDDKKVVKDLIETNVRQRGTIGGTDEQIRKRVDALKEYYGIKHGGERSKSGNSTLDGDPSNLKEVVERAGVTVDQYRLAQSLGKAIPEVKELIENGKVSPSIAGRLIARLSADEQYELLAVLPDAVERFTQSQVRQYIDQIQGKDVEIADLKAAKEEAERQAEIRGQEAVDALNAVKASDDSDRYMEMKKQRDDMAEKYRQEYEARRQDKEMAREQTARTAKEVQKLEKRLADAEARANAVPTEIKVEVPPADYEELKEKARFYDERLKDMGFENGTVHPMNSEERQQQNFEDDLERIVSGLLPELKGVASCRDMLVRISGNDRKHYVSVLTDIATTANKIIAGMETGQEVA